MMTTRNQRRGFTLAEIIIVVAVIAVLVAIAIPSFAARMEQTRQTVDIANARSAYSGMVVECLTGSKDGFYYYDHGEITQVRPTQGYGRSKQTFQSFCDAIPVTIQGAPVSNGKSNYITALISGGSLAWMQWGGYPAVTNAAEFNRTTQAERRAMDIQLMNSIRDVLREMTYGEIIEMFCGSTTLGSTSVGDRKVEKWTGTCFTIADSYIMNDGTIDKHRNHIYAEELFRLAGYNTSVDTGEAYLFTSWDYGSDPKWQDDLKMKVEIGVNLADPNLDLNQKATNAYVYINGNGLKREDETFGHNRPRSNW